MKKFWEKLKIFGKELFNALTNLLCPILSIICAFAELVHLPDSVIQGLKKAEYWCFFVSGTKESIDKLANTIDKSIEDETIEFDEVISIVEDTLVTGNKIVKAVDKTEKEKREE